MEVTLNMEDIKDVERVINSDAFAQFLLNNTTSFSAAAFILQSIHEATKQAKEQLDS